MRGYGVENIPMLVEEEYELELRRMKKIMLVQLNSTQTHIIKI